MIFQASKSYRGLKQHFVFVPAITGSGFYIKTVLFILLLLPIEKISINNFLNNKSNQYRLFSIARLFVFC
jgi:hypothetical protein